MSKRNFSSAKRTHRKLRGLVTSFEAGLTPAFRKSAKTDKSTAAPTDQSQRTFATTECEDEEFNGDDFDNIFISPEDERKIHFLLQFAQQGKINTSNAFDLPMTVLDPELAQGSLRFWKFASELLGASICIYDKRVENMFLAVNQAFNSFVRAKGGEEVEEEPEETIYQKSRRKKGELMKEDIAEMRASSNMDILKIGMQTLEQTNKINIKKSQLQFQNNVLFKMMLQAFDSNSLKGLFLNTLQINHYGQLVFFCDNFCCKAEFEKIQPKQQFDYHGHFPKFVEQQLSKLNFVCQNHDIYSPISHYLQQYGLKNEGQSNRIDLTQQMQNFQKKQIIFDENVIDQSETELSSKVSEDRFSFHFVSQLSNGAFEKDMDHSQKSDLTRIAVSQHGSKDFLIIEQQDWSVMDPRELENQGMRLNKKRISRSKILLEKGEKKANSTEIVTFNLETDSEDQLRNNIIKVCDRSEQTRNRSYVDRFLLPKSMDPFIQIHRRRKKNGKDAAVQSNDPFNLKPQAAPLANTFDGSENKQILLSNPVETLSEDLSNSFHIEQQVSTEGLKNIKTFGLRSIREIKQQINDRLNNQDSFLLSELCFPISPASTFIVLLHLVNEGRMQLNSIDQEKDVAITK